MEGVIRKMTSDELHNLTVDGVHGINLNKPKRQKNAREKFEIELKKNEQKTAEAELPFARHVARDDFNRQIKIQVDDQLKKYGSIEKPEELKLPVMDWNKYSDLKNFEVISKGEVPDTNLTKQNPGLNVKIKTMVYKFKGYGQIYRVMESGPDAIMRAIKARAKLDDSIKSEMNK